ncbi:MAG: membrane protein insertase YidC [Lentimicrobiaceae bacterium]|nr:membrane protein insertase YidC [Lentimicrobiaceae bacterium]
MDKNSLIGIILILGILIGWSVWMTPSKEEIAQQRHIQDSINRVNRERFVRDSISMAETNAMMNEQKETKTQDETFANRYNMYGSFADASMGDDKTFVLENEVIKMNLSSRGAYVETVELKDYKTYDSLPLIGFDEETSRFNLEFIADGKGINSYDLYFEPYINGSLYEGDYNINVGERDSLVMSLRAYVSDAEGNKSMDKYLEFRYTMYKDQYMVGFDIVTNNLKGVIPANTRFMTMDWFVDVLKQEKATDRFNVETIYYMYSNNDVETLSQTEAAEAEEELSSGVKWISFKQKFFSYALVSKDSFDDAFVEMHTKTRPSNARYQKSMSANIEVPFDGLNEDNTIAMSYYFGPNDFKELKQYDINLEKQIPLGGKLVAWINRLIVIPVFDWLGQYGWSYGVVILILTLIIKICLMPIAFKSYMSSAKMRVLKPEIEAINAKYPKPDDAMKKQQAIMDLYKKAGASPTSGCLPMLLQFPILIAIFRFFPSSIELRQQPFLWADDLSTYDSILDLPFNIPFYGDHVSLFTLLMTASTLLYTYINNKQMQQAQGDQAMPGMKLMMYLMPIMFLGIFNSYSAGLSYYYLLVNLFSFLQMYIFKISINEDRLRRQIEQAKKKPVKKSNFQKRLEEMQKQQQQQMRR